MKLSLKPIQERIGVTGLAALALLAVALAFSNLVVKPLKEKSAILQEQATDWLAKLHGIGAATGVQLKSASYRSQKTDARIVRYEMVLPVAGSYAQIREFLQRSLAEVPVLSVDQLNLKRDGKNANVIQAEMRLTLHMVKS